MTRPIPVRTVAKLQSNLSFEVIPALPRDDGVPFVTPSFTTLPAAAVPEPCWAAGTVFVLWLKNRQTLNRAERLPEPHRKLAAAVDAIPTPDSAEASFYLHLAAQLELDGKVMPPNIVYGLLTDALLAKNWRPEDVFELKTGRLHTFKVS